MQPRFIYAMNNRTSQRIVSSSKPLLRAKRADLSRPFLAHKNDADTDSRLLRRRASYLDACQSRNMGLQPELTTNSHTTIQRYTRTGDGKFNVSDRDAFAVSATEAYPKSLYVRAQGDRPTTLPGGLAWNMNGEHTIQNEQYTKYTADLSKYEGRRGLGSGKGCDVLARELTSDSLPGKDQSITDLGGVLYDSKTGLDLETGWQNHYASVVMKDGDDQATFETAAGIEDTWIGIYGKDRGQSFKYKTQEANIDRLMGIEDAVIPAETRVRKRFLDYLLCRPGREVIVREEIRYKMGISPEQGEQWKEELQAWKRDGTPPTSDRIKKIVSELEKEFE